MEKIKKYIKIFFEKLSSKPRVDGIEIENTFVKYAYFDGLDVKTFMVKVPPGVIEDGKLKNKEIFVNLLKNLVLNVQGLKKKSNLRANVLLPSPLIFTQLFTIPVAPEKELKNAVELNLRMISPFSEGEGNKSAQILFTDGLNYELLGAFVSKKEVIAYQEALMEAGIIPVSFEFASLSLARFLRKYFKILPEIILVLEVSSAGLDVSVLREKKLVFNYFKSWHNLSGGMISEESFEELIVEEMKKVFNFAYSKFDKSFEKIFFIAPGLESKLAEIIFKNFNIHPEPILVKEMENKSSFYSVIGGALSWEEIDPEVNCNCINLGGEELSKSIYEEQIINFVNVWRGILSAVFGFLLLIYLWGNIFVAKQYQSLENQFENFKPPLDEKKLQELKDKAKTFNSFVAELTKVGASKKDFSSPLYLFNQIAIKNRIVLKSINLPSIDAPLNVVAEAPSYNIIFKFKESLEKEGNFKEVEIPLTQIITNPDNSVSFFVSLKL